jgi:uncharacterized SAM-binding protein YcdF (DUF218 family)
LFFALSKTLGTLVVLPNFLALLGVIGVALLWTRHAAVGRRLLVGSFVALSICGVTPLGKLMLMPLEERYPPWSPTQEAPSGIIVLGGGINPDISAARGVAVSDIGIDRVIAAARLARRYPHARIIYTGGSANLVGSDAREADFAVQVLTDLGISPERVEVERNSRNTVENAVFTKTLASPKPGERWLLITSASHMPRSIGLFCKVGFDVEPVPTGWRTSEPVSLFEFGSFVGGLTLTNIATREWIGLGAAWITGKTDRLFPGPSASSGC